MAKQSDYQTLNQELETVLAALQRPDIDVDEAVKLYERGLKLTADIEDYVKQAELKIKKLKLRQAAGGTDV